MKPEIIQLPETTLIGMNITMSIVHNKTGELWRTFMPQKHRITGLHNQNLYSVEVYPYDYFNQFDPTKEFQKWAAVAVNSKDQIPEGMQSITIPEGKYARFVYQGKSSEAAPFFQNLYSNWLPEAGLQVAHRPHLAVMGEKYKNDHPDSEEDILVPIK